MLYDDMAGHDALLEEVAIDVIGQSVTIKKFAYPDAQSQDRIAIALAFNKVEAVQTTANLKELARHQFAGHVAYWQIVKRAGTSYFYLAAGCLSVSAKTAPILQLL